MYQTSQSITQFILTKVIKLVDRNSAKGRNMKSIVILLAISIILVSCNKGSDSSSAAATGACADSAILGTYKTTGETMTISADCKISSVMCASTTTFSGATAASGYMTVTVSSTNGAAGCLALGSYNCAYQLASNVLTYNCGGGSTSITKQ